MINLFVYHTILYVTSFISLFTAFFWLSVLYLEEKQLNIEEDYTTENAPVVTILIPAYNEEDVIAKTIESIEVLDYPKDKIEVIVLANACTDRTEDIVKSYKHKGIKLVSIKEPGKGHAVNIGLQKAKGKFIATFDADTIATPNLLKRALPYFADEKVAAVKTSIKVLKPENFLEKLQWFEYMGVALQHRLMSALDVLFITPGAFSIYRKDVLKKVGGFDEHSLTEDIEIAMRLLHEGWKVKASFTASPFTKVPRTFAAFHTQRLRWARGFFSSLLKHKDMLLNKKFELLGMLILPLNFLLPILIIVGLFVLIYNIASALIFLAIELYLTKSFVYTSTAYTIDYSALFWTIFLIIIGTGIFLKTFGLLKEKAQYPLAVLFYFLVYPIIRSFYWLFGAIYELTNAKKDWRGSERW